MQNTQIPLAATLILGLIGLGARVLFAVAIGYTLIQHEVPIPAWLLYTAIILTMITLPTTARTE